MQNKSENLVKKPNLSCNICIASCHVACRSTFPTRSSSVFITPLPRRDGYEWLNGRIVGWSNGWITGWVSGWRRACDMSTISRLNQRGSQSSCVNSVFHPRQPSEVIELRTLQLGFMEQVGMHLPVISLIESWWQQTAEAVESRVPSRWVISFGYPSFRHSELRPRWNANK